MTLTVGTLLGRHAAGEVVPSAHLPTPPQEEKKEIVKPSGYDWRTIVVASALALSILCLVTTLALFQPVYAAVFGALSVALAFATYFVYQYTKLRSLSEQVDALEANNNQLRQTSLALQKVNFDLRVTSKANLAQLALLEKQNWQLGSSIEELEEHRSGLKKQEEDLRSEVDRLKETIDSSTYTARLEVLKDINGEIHNASHKLGSTLTLIGEHELRLADRETALQEVNSKLVQTEERIRKAEEELSKTIDRMKALLAQEESSSLI